MEGSVAFETTPKYAKSYFVNLCQCMSLKDGNIYTRIYIFQNSYLLTLSPEDIVCYFNMKAFGTMYPDDDATLKFGRYSSLMFYKKINKLIYATKIDVMEYRNSKRKSNEKYSG